MDQTDVWKNMIKNIKQLSEHNNYLQLHVLMILYFLK
jgi:uncharacterized membrane protein